MYFELSAKETRGLAFDFAKKLNLKVPALWEAARMAGEDWITSFLKRHQTLSIRKPEATNLACATSFNGTNVERNTNICRATLRIGRTLLLPLIPKKPTSTQPNSTQPTRTQSNSTQPTRMETNSIPRLFPCLVVVIHGT
ncbi:unnamed protein product [Lasius platythorax]|uniref:HTH CENPB-type domain-containing protein n=1 Tax=Lasius platythorax TaxID=488582 RepID=A0AAV2NUZ4_9HYME